MRFRAIFPIAVSLFSSQIFADGLPALFRPHLAAGPSLRAIAGADTADAVPVDLNPEALESNVFEVPLGSDSTVVFVKERRTQRVGHEFFGEKFESIFVEFESENGMRLLTPITRDSRGRVIASFWKNGLRYELSPDADGNYSIRKTPASDFSCGVIREHRVMENAISAPTVSSRRRAANHGEFTVLRVAILVCSYFDGEIGISEADSLVFHNNEILNATLSNSRVPARVDIAGIKRVTCPPIGLVQDLSNFAQNLNGPVQSFRNSTRSHLAALYGKSPGDRQALGQALRTFPNEPSPEGVAVVGGYTIVPGSMVYVHEMGHRLGGDHEPGATLPVEQDPAPMARDYFRCDPEDNIVLGALTAYASCGNTQPMPYFSNPNVLVGGAAIGVPGVQDNAQVMTKNLPMLKSYVQ